MKQGALIRRKQWDVLFVGGSVSNQDVEEAVNTGKVAGNVQSCRSGWADRRIWYERNWQQFWVDNRDDVVFVSADPAPWHSSVERFLGKNYLHAEPSWQKRQSRRNEKAMDDVKRMVKRFPDKHVFVYFAPGEEIPWGLISEFAEETGCVAAVTGVHSGGGLSVPWLWVDPRGPAYDLPFADDIVELTAEEAEAIDEAIAVAEDEEEAEAIEAMVEEEGE